MILKSQLEQVVNKQLEWMSSKKKDIAREQAKSVDATDGFASIITGIRRCGKSTLMKQIMGRYKKEDTLYLNFDDIHLSSFEKDDFVRLYSLIAERKAKVLFFDEIQLVSGWEVFVHQLLREEYMVYITGSNASMLSAELGTHLTGRHLSTELFPFSYEEYLTFCNKKRGKDSFLSYLTDGGMPEYLSTHDSRVPVSMVDDILVRDIAIRHGIRNIEPMKRLAVYLLTNVAKPFSGNRLTSVIGDISTSTVLDYVDYMRDAYLIDTASQYTTNIRASIRNPKKVYAIDTGIVNCVSLSQTDDLGRLLENYQFLQLRKRAKGKVYYYRGKGECDFVVAGLDNSPKELYQVCQQLTEDNMQREIDGLREAMRDLHLHEGTIVTLADEDVLNVDEGVIHIVRAYA